MLPTSVTRFAARYAAVIAILIFGSSQAAASPIYTADNGVPGGNAVYDPGNSALVGNYFTTVPGFNLITSISVYWTDLPGVPVTLGIVNDPNGDGNLSDGVVLRSFDVTPTAGDLNMFVTYGFAPTPVSSGFFVAAYIGNGPGGIFPVPFDTSGASNGSRGVQEPGSFLTLARDALLFPPDATWMIRADAQGIIAAVPEPSTFGLALIGLAGAHLARRRTRRA